MENPFLHHAYLIESAPQIGERFLIEFLSELGVEREGNPDYHEFKGDSFTIDEARLVRTRAQGKPFGERKVFILSAPRFTLEAQNSLLKTLEEPYENTHFFILIHARDLLLPTLLSRVHILRPEEKTESEIKDTKEFLELTPPERIKWIKKFVDKEKSLSTFLDDLIRTLQHEKRNEEIRRVYKVRRFVDDPAALPRLILEHLALVIK